jgi:hypothetical protein
VRCSTFSLRKNGIRKHFPIHGRVRIFTKSKIVAGMSICSVISLITHLRVYIGSLMIRGICVTISKSADLRGKNTLS